VLNPQGITYNSFTEEYAIVDASEDEVYIVDSSDCSLIDQFDTGDFGANNPTGITYNSTTDEYAIIDGSDDMVYIVAISGSLENSFETPGTNPTGITYNPTTGHYAIVDADDDEIYFVDTDGYLIDQCDIYHFGCDNPLGIAYNPSTQEYAILDRSDGKVYIVDSSCNLLAQFDTSYGIEAPYPIGITCNSPIEYTILDISADEFYIVDISGKLEYQFDISHFGCDDSSGLAYIPITNEVAILDLKDRAIYITSITGNHKRTIYLAPEITIPKDVAFNTHTNKFVVVDYETDTVYIVDPFTGAVISKFSLGVYGCTHPSGLGYNSETREYMISCDYNRMVIITNTDGNLLRQFATDVFFSSSPQDIDYILPSGNYALADNSKDEVYIANSMGFGEIQFDTRNFGASDPQSIAYNQEDGYILLVDDYQDEVYILDIPNVLKATTLSGTFTGTIKGQPSSLRLRETGQGFLSGDLRRVAAVYNAPSYFDTVSAEVTLNLLNTPYGNLTYVCTVSEDLNTITCPEPIGVFQRKLN